MSGTRPPELGRESHNFKEWGFVARNDPFAGIEVKPLPDIKPAEKRPTRGEHGASGTWPGGQGQGLRGERHLRLL